MSAPPPATYHDDNWLTVEIQICVGGFRGEAGAAILTGELVAFMSQLRPLFETLQGSAQFATLEEQLVLRLTGDGKGHIQLHGEMADQPRHRQPPSLHIAVRPVAVRRINSCA